MILRWTWLGCLALLWMAGCTLPLDGIASRGPRDSGMGPEAGLDAGRADAAVRDAGNDAGTPDAGIVDARVADAGADDAGPPSPCPSADLDLVLCLPFEGDVSDGSSYGNHGIPINVTFGVGPVGAAAVFAANSALVVPAARNQDVVDATVEAWVRADLLPDTGERMGVMDANGQLSLFIHEGGDVRCRTSGFVASDPGGLSLGVWTHYACVFTTSEVRIFRNGERIDTQVSSRTARAVVGAWIGENGTAGDDQLIGSLDEVRWWRTARTDPEIRAEFLRGTPP